MIPRLALISLLSAFVILPGHSVTASEQPTAAQKTLEEVVGYVNQYCGVCHKVPPPDVMPKKDWPRVVQVMADLATERMGQELIPQEVIKHITAYYYGSAPDQLPKLPYFKNSNRVQTFESSALGKQSAIPLVININAVQLGTGNDAEFLICDAERNQVLLLALTDGAWQETVLAEVDMPSHTEVVDYDLDGDNDIIVASLGTMSQSDKATGKVLLLRQSAAGTFEREVLLEGVGRTTDARPVDLDNDGDLDLVVAVFGGGEVGGVIWLENLGSGKYLKHDIINASGVLNISLADLNDDGKTDINSLVAQEYEMVLALVNQGAGKFEQVAIAEAPHPMFGSTGMRVVDLDGDSDTDILFTNGDANDLQLDPKPYHGIQWLENKGDLVFQFHDIGRFYGTATAIAGDLDSDGDLDIVAGSWNNYWENPQRQSLIWFENDGKQNFTRQNIARQPQGIVSIELKDITGDDRLDIIAGVFRMDLLLKKMQGNSSPDHDPDSSSGGAGLMESRIVLLKNKVLSDPPHE